MTKEKYERIGQFIYGAHRHGGDIRDIDHWMADDLGLARSTPGDDPVTTGLFAAFFAKYACDDEFQANYALFIDTLKSRGT